MTTDRAGSDNAARAVFVVWWYRAVVTATFVFFAVLLASLATSSTSTAVGVLQGAVAVVMIAIAVRAGRCARLVLEDGHVVITTLARTHRIPLSDVRAVTIGRGSSAGPLPWRVPVFELGDGRVVAADEIRSMRPGLVPDQAVAAVEARLARGR